MFTTTVTPEAEQPPSTLVNALLGAVVGVVFGFIPFSTVLGGGVAGYLQGRDRRAGLRVGAIAGALMAIPFVLVVVLGLGVFTVVTVSSGAPGPSTGISIGAIVLVLGVVLVASLYTIGGAALGGYLGAYLKEDREGR
jgi:hypothetical protein